MEHFSQIISRAFWDTWDLVIDRSLGATMVALAIFCSTVYWRCRNEKRHNLEKTLKDIWVGTTFTLLAFVLLFLVNVFAVMKGGLTPPPPPISLSGIELLPPYEAGKPIRFVIKANNTAPGLKLRGRVKTVVGLIGDRSVFKSQRERNEQKYWADYEQDAKTADSTAKLSCTVGAFEARIDGPALTEIAVEHLNGPDGFVYVMGQLDYGLGALDFCGCIEAREPAAVNLCVDHNGPVSIPVFK